MMTIHVIVVTVVLAEKVGANMGPARKDKTRKMEASLKGVKTSSCEYENSSLVHARAYLACAQAVLGNAPPRLKLACP